MIVDESWGLSCSFPSQGASTVYEISATGGILWQTQLEGSDDFSSPALVDLTGSGVTDVLIGSSAGLYPLSGADGSFLFGTTELSAINNCSMQNAPAVAYVDGLGQTPGWRVFETCGGTPGAHADRTTLQLPTPRDTGDDPTVADVARKPRP